MAELRHGAHVSYTHGGCRCPACSRASRIYNKKRRALIHQGGWKPWGDLDVVLAHLRELNRQGMGGDQIAAQSTVDRTTVFALMRGDRSKVRADAAVKLLALRVDLNLLPPGARIDSTGTRRRLQALAVIGWSMSRLGPEVGVDRRTLTGVMWQPTVEARTARPVRDVYDKLWNQEPPVWSGAQRRAIENTKRRAAELGWLPPAAWEDELLDLSDEAMWAVLDARVSKWRMDALRRAAESFEAGDRSPLTVAAARAAEAREVVLSARKAAREAAHVG